MKDDKRKKFSTTFVNDEKMEITYHFINSENPNKSLRRIVSTDKTTGIQEIRIEEGTIITEGTRSYVNATEKSYYYEPTITWNSRTRTNMASGDEIS